LVELDNPNCNRLWLAVSFFLDPISSEGRPVGESMIGDGVEHLLVEILPARSLTVSLDVNQGLKRFQSLDGSFKADSARL
jgi:hypothetical protein